MGGSTHPSSPKDWRKPRPGSPHALIYIGSEIGWYMAPSCEGENPRRPGDEFFSQSGKSQVYVIHAPALGYVKIGHSKDIQKRLYTLQNGSPAALSVVKVYPGGKNKERVLHDIFQKYWVRGEWFRDEVLELLPE